MIGHLRGVLVDKRPNQILVDVGGVGYQVAIPFSTFYALGELHSEITLLVHTHLSEDTITLFGFLTTREKHLFELLISASGIGPKLALKILSHISVDQVVQAIHRGDVEELTRIRGVGKKTAERIVFELRDKLAAMQASEEERPAASRTGIEADAISALLNLGYDGRAAEKAVAEAKRDGAGTSFEALLRAALRQLSSPGTKS